MGEAKEMPEAKRRQARMVTLDELVKTLRRSGWDEAQIELLMREPGPPTRVPCGEEMLIVKR